LLSVVAAAIIAVVAVAIQTIVRIILASVTMPPRTKQKPTLDASVVEIETLGAAIMRREVGGSGVIFERRWIEFFGVEPLICYRLLTMMNIDPDSADMAGTTPSHLLWALMMLKGYETQTKLAAFAGPVDEKTFRKWAIIYIKKIAQLEDKVVSAYNFNSF